MEIYKFGGASVNSVEAIKNVAAILRNEVREDTLVVFSAMGKTTNEMEILLDAFWKDKEEKEDILKKLLAKHLVITQTLFPLMEHPLYDQLKNMFLQLAGDLKELDFHNYDAAYDTIVSYGERFSTLIISEYLNNEGINCTELDARHLIKTNNHFREGKVDWELTEKLVVSKVKEAFEEGRIVLTQGFISSDKENHTTTLGREGSDYSAAIFAYCLNAKKITIWKDVPGVLNADPKFFSHTQKMEYISYSDATELAYFGASIIHPKTIKPLQNKSIPLHVRSFVDPQEKGTWIGLENVVNTQIPSYIFKAKQVLLSIYPKDFSFIEEESLASIFSVLVKYNIRVNLMQNSALSFSVCVDECKGEWRKLISDLENQFDFLYNTELELITVRHYTQKVIDSVVNNRPILLEQRSRNTVQMVIKNGSDI